MNTGRSFDRLVNFTDAVVAVAITVLVLPLVDIRAQGGEQTVWQMLGDHLPELFAFAYTFFVVASQWEVHNRTFNRMRGFDDTVFRLNLVWLLGIVLLPWPSALYGEGIGETTGDFSGGEGLGGAGVFYWGTLAVISTATAAVGAHLRRHPELLDPDNRQPGRHPLRGLAFTGAFIVLGVVSLFAPRIGSWMALLLIPLSIAFARAERTRANASSGVSDGT